MRNESVEEVMAALVSESRAGQATGPVGEGKTKGVESNKGQKRGGSEEQPGNEAKRLHSERQACPRQGNGKARGVLSQAMAKPREVAKPSGTPKSRIVTRPVVSARALRANRSAHVNR